MAQESGIAGALNARNVMISDEQWETLRDMAHVERVSISEIIREAIERELKRRARAA